MWRAIRVRRASDARALEREAHAGELLGALPQPPGALGIARRAAAAHQRGVAALLAEPVRADVGAPGDVLGRGVERRQRAHLVALRDHLVADRYDGVLDRILRARLQVGRGVAGMRRDRADAGAGRGEPPLELEREEQVRELRLPVGAPALVGAPLPVEVVDGE